MLANLLPQAGGPLQQRIIRAGLSSSWESDISTHSLTLPFPTCLELLLTLSGNNATLPPSLHFMNSFRDLKETLEDTLSFCKRGD
ncbi:E3 ubiquitin-protein ligase E3D [Manis javanica]|nr:E3 ubiquitin-protein ligase E3D [Manis javanica]